MNTDDPGVAGAFDSFHALFLLIGVVVVGGLLLTIGLAVYRGTRMARRGQNPLTLHEDLADRVSNSEALRREPTKEERLAEVDRLRAAGTITADEHATARARIIAE